MLDDKTIKGLEDLRASIDGLLVAHSLRPEGDDGTFEKFVELLCSIRAFALDIDSAVVRMDWIKPEGIRELRELIGADSYLAEKARDAQGQDAPETITTVVKGGGMLKFYENAIAEIKRLNDMGYNDADGDPGMLHFANAIDKLADLSLMIVRDLSKGRGVRF